MINIFTILNDIITDKKGDLLANVEDEDQFSPYLVSRWLSMYSPEYAEILNRTSNKYYSVFDSKKSWYEFLIRIIPKGSRGRIVYIKKEKPKQIDNYDDVIKFLAKQLELSQREVENYVNQSNIDLSKIKTALK